MCIARSDDTRSRPLPCVHILEDGTEKAGDRKGEREEAKKKKEAAALVTQASTLSREDDEEVV